MEEVAEVGKGARHAVGILVLPMQEHHASQAAAVRPPTGLHAALRISENSEDLDSGGSSRAGRARDDGEELCRCVRGRPS
jgi:hypothetical protein